MSSDLNKPPSSFKKTQTLPYSIIRPEDAVAKPIESLTIKDVVTLLIEQNVNAWKALPSSVRNALMERPKDFQLLPAKDPAANDMKYNILYNGTIWQFSKLAMVWVIIDIVR